MNAIKAVGYQLHRYAQNVSDVAARWCGGWCGVVGGDDERHWSASGTGGRGYDGAAPARPIKAAVVSGQFSVRRGACESLTFFAVFCFTLPVRRELSFRAD